MDFFTDNRTKITGGIIGLVQVLRIVGVLPAELAEPVTALLGGLAAIFLRLGMANEAKKTEVQVEKVAAKVEHVETKIAQVSIDVEQVSEDVAATVAPTSDPMTGRR